MAQMTDDYEAMAKHLREKGEPLLAAIYEVAFQLSRLNDNIEDVTEESRGAGFKGTYIRVGD